MIALQEAVSREIPHALQAAGDQAAVIARHWTLMYWLGIAVFVSVCIALGIGFFEGRRRAVISADSEHHRERTSTRAIIVAMSLTLVILLVVFVDSIGATRNAGKLRDTAVRVVEIEGVQWWWRVRYLDADPTRVVETANELHLPRGEVVRLRLISGDVIHSFWVPQLHGKMDLVPGRTNEIAVRATHTGSYRGLCAEFCGLQHAHMQLMVVVHEPDEFDEWFSRERAPATPAPDSLTTAGAQVFAQRDCATCHRVRGTEALGTVGPDLTHFASRLTIGAGVLDNTRGHLAGWIGDPQSIKPGTRMPRVELTANELQALIAYVGSLR